MIDEASPEAAETAEQVWQRTTNPNPITKDDVRGSDPKPEAPVLPDRALVTGQLEEIFAQGQTHSDPLADKLAALEESLVPRQEPEHPEVYKEIQALRAELAARDEAAKQAAIEEEREARLRTVREGFVESLRESEDFPAIKAAGYEEKLFDTILAKQQAGEDVSEEELLSKTESELWGLYEALSAVKSSTTSQEPKASDAPQPQTPTLTPSLSGQDAPRTLEDIYADVRGDRKAAAAEIWDNIMNR